MKAIAISTLALFVGLAASWYAWQAYQQVPLSSLPEVDLSAAPTAVKTAIQNARKAVVAAPRSGTAWGELGLSLRAHKFDREANLCLAQAMHFDPREITWPYVRGSSLSLRDRPEAERCFRIAAGLRPDLALPRLRLAELYLEQRRLDEAQAELDAAITIEPESARAMLALAQVAFARGDIEAARKWADDSFARDSMQRTTAEMLLRIYHRLGDQKAADRQQALLDAMPPGEAAWEDPYTERVLRLRRDPEGLAEAASELLSGNRVAEAIVILENLVASDPDDAQLSVLLARALIRHGNNGRAARVLDDARERHADSADIHFQRGVVYFLDEQWKAAAAEFRRARDLKPDFRDALYNLGHTLAHLGDRDGAIAAFREAVRFRPGDAASYTNLGRLLLESGESAAGREALETALKLDPDDPQTRKLLKRMNQK